MTRRTEVVAGALASLARSHRCARPLCRVADVGAGDGAIGRRVAAAVGAQLSAFDVRPSRDARGFDGLRVPAADDAFDVALLSDVLHHADAPELLLRECLRVAPIVLIKDHFAEGRWDEAVLTVMDLWGNAARGVASPGRYLSALGWRALFQRVGAQPVAWLWPLDVHPAPIRLFTRSERQFVARLERAA